MGFLDKFAFPDDKLIVFYIGGRVSKCHLELHDVMFFVGKSSEEIVPRIKENWFGTPKSLHVDSWYALENVEGYDISFGEEQGTSSLSLFFVNLGAYKRGVFGELHYMSFVVAESAVHAKAKAKKHLEKDLVELHTDDLYDLDDIIELKNIDGRQIVLRPGQKTSTIPVNGWQRIV